MTPEEFGLAIDRLVAGGLRLPYGFLPGTHPGGRSYFEMQEQWEDYGWNPPQFIAQYAGPEGSPSAAYSDPDPNADPKPTWAQIEAAVPLAKMRDTATRLFVLLNDEESLRITRAYGVRTVTDEILLRLRNGASAAQDTERDRLHLRRIEIETDIQAAQTPDELDAIDVSADALWAAQDDANS